MRFFATVSALIGASAVAHAIQTINVVGNKFFGSSDGKQLFLKGVAYQLNPCEFVCPGSSQSWSVIKGQRESSR